MESCLSESSSSLPTASLGGVRRRSGGRASAAALYAQGCTRVQQALGRVTTRALHQPYSCAARLALSALHTAEAARPLPQEMGSRHRARAPVIQIIKTATVPAALCKRDSVKQFHDSKIRFPLTIRSVRCAGLCRLTLPALLAMPQVSLAYGKPQAVTFSRLGSETCVC